MLEIYSMQRTQFIQHDHVIKGTVYLFFLHGRFTHFTIKLKLNDSEKVISNKNYRNEYFNRKFVMEVTILCKTGLQYEHIQS